MHKRNQPPQYHRNRNDNTNPETDFQPVRVTAFSAAPVSIDCVGTGLIKAFFPATTSSGE
jgi:hypothetical protein